MIEDKPQIENSNKYSFDIADVSKIKKHALLSLLENILINIFKNLLSFGLSAFDIAYEQPVEEWLQNDCQFEHFG